MAYDKWQKPTKYCKTIILQLKINIYFLITGKNLNINLLFFLTVLRLHCGVQVSLDVVGWLSSPKAVIS